MTMVFENEPLIEPQQRAAAGFGQPAPASGAALTSGREASRLH